MNLDPDNVANSTLNVKIESASVSTGFSPLDDHLKTADYLNVEKFPEITFVSTSVKQTGDTTAEVIGDLTLHGVTKSVTLDTTLVHRDEHPVGQFLDHYKGKWVGFKATTTIDHQASI